MLNSLLDLNQIEVGAVRTESADISIDEILLRLTDGFAYDAQAKGLSLRVVPCKVIVHSDPRLLEQMMRNLLANAIKYTRQGRILLGCRRRGDRLSIEVWDTGIGIAEHDLSAIFREYHQLDGQAGRSRRGLGLGLSIVRRFGALLDHDIRVRSVFGTGSMFAIEVMRASGGPQITQARAEATIRDASVRSAARAGNILLIDDDPDTCEILGGLLRDEGYQVLTAGDGVQALAMVAQDGMRPDLIVTDSKLPAARNGPEIIATLRARLNQAIPVITLTGDVLAEAVRTPDLRNAIRLTKPVRLHELTNAIQRLLSVSSGVSLTAATRPQDDVDPGLNGSTIFIVDDNEEVSAAIRAVVEGDGGQAEAYATSEAFAAGYRPGRTACLLIDAYLPGMNGLDMLRHLRDQGDAIPAIMITGNSDVSMAVQAMKAGAADFIEKPVSAAELLASIKHALGHARESDRRLAWSQGAACQIAELTARQREIMAMVMAGHPSKNIAADLGISQRTVENHRASIMRKTNTKSLPALARLALAASWAEASGLR
jgi:two-component system CheB/CheR fusion protein